LRVDEVVLKCVAFVGEMIATNQPGDLHGTGFFVSVPPESPQLRATGERFAYFVTAKHVAGDLQDRPIYMRVNKVGGGVTDFQNTCGNHWYLHPTDTTADVAVVPLASQPTADVKTIGIELLGTPELLSRLQIGIGDEVFSTGLFTPIGETTSMNMPIVRHGNISMMPEEQIQTEFGYADVYLVEARSLGGLSGSPVFVRPTMKIDIPEICGINKMLGVSPAPILLGLMHGHWDVKESEMNAPYFVNDRKHGVNYGMAIVVPASKIIDVINREELVQMRAEVEKHKLSRMAGRSMVPGVDSAKHGETQDEVFAQHDFDVALKKATRKTK
jgi:hypothetical protein